MNGLFQKLEEKLLNPNIRKSAQEIENLLSDDFIEFGSSGRVFNKQQVIEFLLQESSDEISISELKAAELSNGVALVTYKATRHVIRTGADVVSLRSSVWKMFDSSWKMVFHQGTAAIG